MIEAAALALLDVVTARPILWMLLLGFAIFLGLIADEMLNRKRGFLAVLYAMSAAACYGAATAFASS